MRRNELSNHKKTWRKFQCIFLSERRQSEKATYYMIPTLTFGKDKILKTVKRSVVTRFSGEEGKGKEAQEMFMAVKLFSIIL